MYERITKISKYLNEEEKDPSSHINPELLKKFCKFKKWLIENGAIFTKNIDFPYTYGPFHLIGCKCISEIKENESIFLIPKKLMIISKELDYLDEFIDSIEEELYENDDIPTICLTLNLYLENKNKNSFFRPYLDLIFSNYNFLNDFTQENLKYFGDDEKLIESIQNDIEGIEELYNTIKKTEKFKEITKDEFFFCYSQVISRQFYIHENCAALIPLADLLNHNNINIHYEIYDSQNFIFKYSSHFSLESDRIIDIRPTYIKEYPIKNNKIELGIINPFNSNNCEKNKKIINIKEDDYFSISTSQGVTIEKDSQVFNNYFD